MTDVKKIDEQFAAWCESKGLDPERCDGTNRWIRYAFEAGTQIGDRKLRMLLALSAGGRGIYTDDGELSDGTEIPFIDFLRDDPDEIEQKLYERGRKRIQLEWEAMKGEEPLK